MNRFLIWIFHYILYLRERKETSLGLIKYIGRYYMIFRRERTRVTYWPLGEGVMSPGDGGVQVSEPNTELQMASKEKTIMNTDSFSVVFVLND